VKRWTELIVRIADLAEAEGRVLRGVVRDEARGVRAFFGRLGVCAAVLLASVMLVLVGAGFVLTGLFLWLESTVGTAGGAALSGALAILAGVVLIWTYRKTMDP